MSVQDIITLRGPKVFGAPLSTTRLTQDRSIRSSFPANIIDMNFTIPAEAGLYYWKFYVIFQTSNANAGLVVSITYPGPTNSFSGRADMPTTDSGDGGVHNTQHYFRGPGFNGVCLEIPSKNADFFCIYEGIIEGSGSTQSHVLQFQAARDTISGNSVVIIREGSTGFLWRIE